MLYMNEYEIEQAVILNSNHLILGKASRFLRNFMIEVNTHSDGWPYWSLPVHAAKSLMLLLKSPNPSEQDLAKALRPIKAFYTRKGNQIGMRMPYLL